MRYDNLTMPLGVSEIALLLKVKPDTVSSWQLRGIFPRPDAYINDMKTRVWKIQTVFDWARSTGRNNRQFTNYADAGNFMLAHQLSGLRGEQQETPQTLSQSINIDENIGSYDDSNL